MEPSGSIKNHLASQAKDKGRRGWAVGVSSCCQQLTGLPNNGVPGVGSSSQGSPAHFRETSTDQKRSSHWSPSLGTFHTLGSPVPFS